MQTSSFEDINIPVNRINGDYCVCFTVGQNIIWGGETYTEVEAQQLSVARMKQTGLHHWVRRKEDFGKTNYL